MEDPYVEIIDGEEVLKNKFHAGPKKLKKIEADLCLMKIITAGRNYSTNFDVQYIKDLHKHIFGDIYEWAGQFRTVPIYKEERVIPALSLEYTPPRKIEQELEKQLYVINNIDWDSLDFNKKAMQYTNSIAKLWRIHPFREGNTRTIMTFASLFARSHNFPLDMSCIIPNLTRKYGESGKILRYSIRDKLVLAALDPEDNPEPEHLYRIIQEAMENGMKKKQNDEKEYSGR